MQYFSLLFSGSCIPGLGDVWLLKGIKNCVMKELRTKLTRVLFLGVNRARLETVKLKEFLELGGVLLYMCALQK